MEKGSGLCWAPKGIMSQVIGAFTILKNLELQPGWKSEWLALSHITTNPSNDFSARQIYCVQSRGRH